MGDCVHVGGKGLGDCVHDRHMHPAARTCKHLTSYAQDVQELKCSNIHMHSSTWHMPDTPCSLTQDLKSPNILLGQHGIAKIADLGLSKVVSKGFLSQVGWGMHWGTYALEHMFAHLFAHDSARMSLIITCDHHNTSCTSIRSRKQALSTGHPLN